MVSSATSRDQTLRRDLDRVDALEPSRAGHRHRVGALDGLRGLAALVVVFSHALIASSARIASDASPSVPLPVGSINWWLTRTPLHLLWAGEEMVLVFFVLSGYVLALPAARLGRRWFDSSYYPRRLIRLYLPAWCALAFGAALHELHRRPVRGGTWWLNLHTTPLSLSDAAHNATLLDQRSLWAFTSVLWSLSEEVLFSLLLPALLLLVLLCARSRVGLVLAAVSCLIVADVCSHPTVIAHIEPRLVAYDVQYLPVFVLGSLLALAPKIRPPEWSFLPAALAGICLLMSAYMWTGFGAGSVHGPLFVSDIVGAVVVVWVTAAYGTASRWLDSRPSQWLGSRSFSLYLVHEPIVVAVAFLGAHGSWPLELAIAVPLSLLAAEIFWRLVERPTVLLARRVGDLTRAGTLRLRAVRSADASLQV